MNDQPSRFVQTVTGPLAIDTVTLADGHAHVWIDPAPEISGAARIELNDYDKVRAELEDFHALGGQLLVDCQPGTAGRDGRILQRLSRETGVAITATTGTHQRIYYAPGSWIWSAGADEAAAWFIGELTVGTAILGIVLFGDPATAGRLACIGLIVAGIVGLKLAT